MNNLNLTSRLSNISSSMQNANEEVIDRVILVDINKLKRNEFNFYDEDYQLEELAESIKEIGVEQPLHISSDYTIISGHRRFKASQLAGISKLPCIIKKTDIDAKLQLVEANRYRTKTTEEKLREVEILKEYYEELEVQGKKPKGRLRDLIAADIGISSATVQRSLDKVKTVNNSSVSNDTKEIDVESIELKEFKKLKRQLNKIIKLYNNEEINIDKYVLMNIYKLRDHINLDKLSSEAVDDNQISIDID